MPMGGHHQSISKVVFSSQWQRARGAVTAAGLGLALLATPRAALTEDLPLSEVLTFNLGLGKGNDSGDGGCEGTLVPGQFVEPSDYAAALLAEGNVGLNSQLVAICDQSTNVGSASSLAAPLGGLQSTKTATQFNFARRRIESRLRKRRSSILGDELRLASLSSDLGGSVSEPTIDAQGWAAYGRVEFEEGDRKATRFEGAQSSNTWSGVVGADYAWKNAVLGGWIGYDTSDFELRAGGAIAGPTDDPSAQRILNSEADLTTLCGSLPGEGEGQDKGFQFGVYSGARVGEYGFIGIEADYSDRTHSYSRTACAIEFASSDSPLAVDADGNGRGRLFVDANNNRVLEVGERIADDIFSGLIGGQTDIQEFGFSAQAGVHIPIGSVVVSPHAGLSYRRTEIDGFTEAGRSLIENTVMSESLNAAQSATACPAGALYLSDVGDTPGDCLANFDASTPSGLELSYHDQVRQSVRSELGVTVAVPLQTDFGAVVPHAGITWRHEFDGDRDRVRFHMAGDRRANPATFEFATNAPDADDAVISAGLTVHVGEDIAATVEVAHVAFNELEDTTAVSARLRWRF